MFLVCQVSGLVENFNTGIFSDTINVINVKLCMMVVLNKLYPFIRFSVTLIVFQNHSSVKQYSLKIVCSYLIKVKLCRVVKYIRQVMNIPLFLIFGHTEGRY